MLLKTKIRGYYNNVIDFVRDWNLEKEFRTFTDFKGEDLDGWFDVCDISDGEIISELLDKQRGNFILDFNEDRDVFIISEVV